MGIYTSNRYLNEAHDWASEIPANEAYDAAFGCAHILADCQANDMALFEHAIYNDFAEVRAVQEGVGYVNENAFTNVIKKIVEMFKKLLSKIKGIFSAFLAKLTGAFKNGKDLVKKYEKQIIKYSNWKDFKCKGILKPNSEDIIDSINTLFKYNETSVGVNADIYRLYLENDKNTLGSNFNNVFGTKDVDKVNDMDAEDIKNKLLPNYLSASGKTFDDITEIHQNIQDTLYNDSEKEINGEDDKVSGSFFSKKWIKSVLNDDKWEKNVKKFNERLEKNINTIIDNLNKADDDLAKWINKNPDKKLSINKSNDKRFADSDNGKIKKNSNFDWTDTGVTATKVSTEAVQKTIHVLQKVAGNEQEVITKVTAEYMTQVKFAMAQARKVWTAAAAWSSGVHKESVEYVNAVAECAAEQFYTNMESVH